ncbi:MAG: hypothetical protein JNM85_05520 [Chthonomonas sp.]|nr:hypothetical protein [Chthonomonas sp.]
MKSKLKLRPVANDIRFWTSASSLGLLLALAGCSANGSAGPATLAPEEVAEKPRVTISVPIPPQAGDLGLVHSGELIRLGDSKASAWQVVPKPKGAYEFTEDPPVLNESMQASVWESRDQSFGLITMKGKVVLAIHAWENVDDATLNSIVADHESAFGPAPNRAQYPLTDYWFWAKGQSRLMVVVATDSRQRRTVSAVIGQYELMDALRMSLQSAEDDAKAAQARLDKLFGAKKATSTEKK